MPRSPSDIKPRIIKAARQRFLAQGVDGASLRRIAQDADTNIGMVYYYFPSKDDLFLAVAEEVYVAVLEDLSVALADDVPVPERLARMYARLGALRDEEFEVLRIVIREALASSSRLSGLIAMASRGHVPLLLRTLSEGVAKGQLTKEVPLSALLVAVGALGLAPQVIRQLLSNQKRQAITLPEPDVLSRTMLEVLLRGTGSRVG